MRGVIDIKININDIFYLLKMFKSIIKFLIFKKNIN